MSLPHVPMPPVLPTQGRRTHRVSIHASPTGGAIVEVDGRDLTKATAGYQLGHAPGGAPVVTLHLTAGYDFEGDALVELVDPGQDADTIVRFLEAIDPEALGQAVLNADGGSSASDPFAAALAILIDQARAIASDIEAEAADVALAAEWDARG